jgi:hypothetical protein
MTPPEKYRGDMDVAPPEDGGTWWMEGPDTYLIPKGTVDIEAALYLAHQAGLACAYSQWAKHEERKDGGYLSITHAERAEWYLQQARKVAGLKVTP